MQSALANSASVLAEGGERSSQGLERWGRWQNSDSVWVRRIDLAVKESNFGWSINEAGDEISSRKRDIANNIKTIHSIAMPAVSVTRRV